MYSDFSSMPPDQEREFVVFEQFTRENAKSSLRIGGIVAAIYGIFVVAIVLSHDKPKPKISAEDIAVESTRRTVVEDDVAAPDAPDPAAAQPSEAAAQPAAGAADAPGGTPAAAPPPPPGATKAPPTQLVQPK